MQIAFDAKRAFRNITGLGNYSRFVIDGLQNHYPDIQKILFTSGISGNQEIVSFFRKHKTDVILPSGLWKLKPLPSVWRSLYLYPEAIAMGADIYHGLSNELPLIDSTKIRKVVTIHDVIFMRYPHLYRRTDRRIYRYKTAQALKSADRIICVSSQTKEDVIHFFNAPESKLRVVNQGIHSIFNEMASAEKVQQFKAAYHIPDHYILSVGTVEERKNTMLLVRACHRLIDEGHHIPPVVLTGRTTPYADEIRTYIDQHQLQAHVILRHDIPFHEFPSLYRGADMLVYPSIYEGFGIPILEAFSQEIPVIAGNTSSLTEVGGDAAFYTDVMDEEELSKLIRELLENKGLAINFGKKGRNRLINHFSSEKISGELMHIYNEL